MNYKLRDLEVHSDERGWLTEILKRKDVKDDVRQIYVASIKPGAVRGNHYHLKRTEWFFVIGEKAKLYLEDLKTKERVCLSLSPKKKKAITIFPKTAHAVKNTGRERIYLISAQNTDYNPKNADVFSYVLVK